MTYLEEAIFRQPLTLAEGQAIADKMPTAPDALIHQLVDDLGLGRSIVYVGKSGTGKSTLQFDVLAAYHAATKQAVAIVDDVHLAFSREPHDVISKVSWTDPAVQSCHVIGFKEIRTDGRSNGIRDVSIALEIANLLSAGKVITTTIPIAATSETAESEVQNAYPDLVQRVHIIVLIRKTPLDRAYAILRRT